VINQGTYTKKLPPLSMFFIVMLLVLLFPSLSFSQNLMITPRLLWRHVCAGKILGRPASSGDRVFLAAEDRYLYALTAEGKMIWRKWLEGKPAASLAVGGDGSVYVGMRGGELKAFNRMGGVIWTYSPEGADDPAGDPVVAPNGRIYYTLKSGEIVSLSHTGKVGWKKVYSNPILLSPSMNTEAVLYVPLKNETVKALAPWGEELWSLTLEGTPNRPTIDGEGNLYIQTDRGKLYKIDPEGRIQWEVYVGSYFLLESAPIISESGVVCVSGDGKVMVYNWEGKLKGSRALPNPAATTPAINDRGILYLFDKKGRGFMVDTESFEVKEFNTTGGKKSSPLLTEKGLLLTGGEDWIVYGFRAGLLGKTPWPQFGSTPDHSGRVQVSMTPLEIEKLFKHNVDYQYLRYLALSPEYKDKEQFLKEIEKRYANGKLDHSKLYIVYLLSYLVSEGFNRPMYEDGKVINDYPDIRLKAAGFLGELGDIRSKQDLLIMVSYEYDSAALAGAFLALGKLGSDVTGEMTAVMTRRAGEAVKKGGPQSVIAAAVTALGRIKKYNGYFPDESAFDFLFAVFQGDCSKTIRKEAIEVLRSHYGAKSN